MYRIVLACYGVPNTVGPTAAVDITREFEQHRSWHQNVRCTWDGTRLILQAENDFDPKGLALADELSDCVAAYVAELCDGEIKVESVQVVG